MRNRRLARKEMNRLIKLAFDMDVDHELRRRYLELAFKISMKYRIRKPDVLKLFKCKNCKSIIIPGVDSIVRVRSRPYKHIAVKCLRCGHVYRKGFDKRTLYTGY